MGERVRLSEDERSRMQHNIREYMSHAPLRSHHVRVQKNTIVALLQYRFTAVLVILAVVFTSGVGVTFASTDALPGDTLYPVKEATEEVQQRLIFDEAKRAEFVIERTHRRLQEIERLAARGVLTDERERIATEKFEELAQRAEKRLTRLEQQQPHEAQALRLALTVGTEARLATLALHSDRASERTNDARVRIAQAIQTKRESVADAMTDTSTTALAPRIAAMSADMHSETRTQEGGLEQTSQVAGEATFETATLPTRAELPTPPIALATLMRNITKQRKALEEVISEIEDEEVQDDIKTVLTRTKEAQSEITAAIQLRDYATAQIKGRETLTLLHKTHAALDAQLDITTSIDLDAPEPHVQEPKEEGEESAPPREPLPLPSIDTTRIR